MRLYPLHRLWHLSRYLALVLSVVLSEAVPVVRDLDWHPACDGSNLEIVSEKDQVISVTAAATHFASIRQWTLHYLDGKPATAEFREYERGRIQQGDDAGKPSGVDPLKRIEVFKAQDGRFAIPDNALQEELADILAKVGAKDSSPLK